MSENTMQKNVAQEDGNTRTHDDWESIEAEFDRVCMMSTQNNVAQEDGNTRTHDDWESIEAEFDRVCMMSTKPGEGFEKVKAGTVIDEERSVRWNREEAERRNAAYAEERRRLEKEQRAAESAVHDRAVRLVASETGLTEERANILWNFVYDKYHACGHDVFNEIGEYMDLIERIIS